MPSFAKKPADATPPFNPFGPFQQTSQHLLVVQDKKTGQIQAIMIDLNDAGAFAKFLEQDCTAPQSGLREVNICLYHLENGIYRTSSEGFDEEALEQNREFLIQKAQAKFLNGAIFYPKAELEALKGWIQKKGAEKLSCFFQEQILAWKPTSRAAYDHSDLARLFKELS
jgi:hypothetical protein